MDESVQEGVIVEVIRKQRPPPDYVHGRRPTPTPRTIRLPLIQYLSARQRPTSADMRALAANLRSNAEEFERRLERAELRFRQQGVPSTIADRPIRFAGFALAANKMHAYNGFKNITVDQHYYARHRLQLRFPFLPCVVDAQQRRSCAFLPPELLDIILPAT